MTTNAEHHAQAYHVLRFAADAVSVSAVYPLTQGARAVEVERVVAVAFGALAHDLRALALVIEDGGKRGAKGNAASLRNAAGFAADMAMTIAPVLGGWLADASNDAELMAPFETARILADAPDATTTEVPKWPLEPAPGDPAPDATSVSPPSTAATEPAPSPATGDTPLGAAVPASSPATSSPATDSPPSAGIPTAGPTSAPSSEYAIGDTVTVGGIAFTKISDYPFPFPDDGQAPWPAMTGGREVRIAELGGAGASKVLSAFGELRAAHAAAQVDAQSMAPLAVVGLMVEGAPCDQSSWEPNPAGPSGYWVCRKTAASVSCADCPRRATEAYLAGAPAGPTLLQAVAAPAIMRPSEAGPAAGGRPAKMAVEGVVSWAQLAQPIDPELRVPYRSVSQLDTYNSCGLKYRLRRYHDVPRQPSWALIGGKAIHAALAQYEGAPFSPAHAGAVWRSAFAGEIAQTVLDNPSAGGPDTWRAAGRGGVEDRLWWVDNGPNQVAAYAAARQTPESWLGKLAPTAVEQEVLFDVDGVSIKGYVDLIEAGERELIVIDHKSGSRKPEDRFQLKTYALAAAEASNFGGSTATVGYLMTRKTELVGLGEIELADARTEVSARFRAFDEAERAGHYPAKPSSYCGSCEVNSACPVWALR